MKNICKNTSFCTHHEASISGQNELDCAVQVLKKKNCGEQRPLVAVFMYYVHRRLNGQHLRRFSVFNSSVSLKNKFGWYQQFWGNVQWLRSADTFHSHNSRSLPPLTTRLLRHWNTYGVDYSLSTAVAPQGGDFYNVYNDPSYTKQILRKSNTAFVSTMTKA